jgi:hypothetical protein
MPLDGPANDDDLPEMPPLQIEMRQTITVRWPEPGYWKAMVYAGVVGFGLAGGVGAFVGAAMLYRDLRAFVTGWLGL